MTGRSIVNNSESREVMRSLIDFADYNPRRISDEARKTLRKGLKAFGLVGGIIVNANRSDGRYTLVSGHQRITEMDALQGFPGKDYPIRVDIVRLSDKEEKELNILLNNPNAQGEWDYEKLSAILPAIDYDIAGLTDADLAFIQPPILPDNDGESSMFGNLETFHSPVEVVQDPARYESEKRRLSEEKRKTNEKAETEVMNHQAYLCLSFSDFRHKEQFCNRFGIPAEETYISGEVFGEYIERID